MCGIAGKFNFLKHNPVTENELKAMAGLIAHRGPDDEGIFLDGPLGLAHRRLSILDLSPAGHQPMSDARGEIWIVFNGEIYNYPELRQELEKDGVKFRSHSDTEVLIYQYRKYGRPFIQRLRGMFAFALWDRRKNRLVLGRDRFGKKPLKYFLDSNRIVFASELKALFADPAVPKTPDYGAIDEFLTYKYVPAPKTGFAGISKLPPAHCLTIDDQGNVELTHYWDLKFPKKPDLPENGWIEKLEEKIRESVRIRLLSDVPLGAILSGGVDSSLVAAIMAQESAGAIKTFTIGFKEPDYDERPFARRVASQYGTDHHEFVVEPMNLDLLPRLVRAYEEPYADASALPSWYLSEIVRAHITVALSGDGGDELFAGYARNNGFLLHPALRIVPAKQLLSSLAGALYARGQNPLFDKARRLLQAYDSNETKFFLNLICYFSQTQKNRITDPIFKEKAADSRWLSHLENFFAQAQGLSKIDKLMYVGLRTHLSDDLLVKADIATMAHGLELRSPLLDQELAALAATVPENLKIKNSENKYILKKIAAIHVPAECLYRPKQGFTVPLEHWFRGGLASYAEELLYDPSFTRRGFDKSGIMKILEEHKSGQSDNSQRIWTLMMLSLWFKEWFSTGF